ncbi:shK domain-like domain-containing protein [Ditylenchus destructor]|nr:shK domain-like domain-containing protein [Ditylenchus destructor]
MKSLCTNEIYLTFMEHQCARTCGKCKVDSEEDTDDISDEDNSHHPNYKEMMKKNCAKTCGYCKPKRGSPQVIPKRDKKDCKDNHPFCKGWAANGYCESEEYTEDEKKDKCAKTCGYC